MKRNFGRRFDHERIGELLTQGIRPIDVAKIVGCSREYVRQLDLQYFGLTGRERNKVRRVANSKIPPVHPFVIAAKEHGYEVKAITKNLRASTFRVIVNGFNCGLFQASKRAIGFREYWVIRHSAWNLDFYIWSTPAGFIILPKGKQPSGATSIAIYQKNKPGAYSRRHDYISYLNAWDQLEQKKGKVA